MRLLPPALSRAAPALGLDLERASPATAASWCGRRSNRRAGPNRRSEQAELQSAVLFDLLSSLPARFSALPFRGKVFGFACLVVAIELALRRFLPKSRLYTAWKRGFEAIGAMWTSVLLAVVYFASVSLVGLAMKLFAKDLLDRRLDREPSFWRAHDPNPLGAKASVRHQF